MLWLGVRIVLQMDSSSRCILQLFLARISGESFCGTPQAVLGEVNYIRLGRAIQRQTTERKMVALAYEIATLTLALSIKLSCKCFFSELNVVLVALTSPSVIVPKIESGRHVLTGILLLSRDTLIWSVMCLGAMLESAALTDSLSCVVFRFFVVRWRCVRVGRRNP